MLCAWHLVRHLIFWSHVWFWKLVRHLALSKALWQGAQDQSEDVRRAAAGQLGRVEACHTELQSSTSIIFNLKIQEDRSRARQNIQTSYCRLVVVELHQRAPHSLSPISTLQVWHSLRTTTSTRHRWTWLHTGIQRCHLSWLQGSRHPSTDIGFLLGGFRTHGFCLNWAWHAWFSRCLCSEFPCSTTLHYYRP